MIASKNIGNLFEFITKIPGALYWMIHQRADALNLQNEMGQTLCHYAARKGDLDALKELLEKGLITTDATDIKGFSFMDYAEREDHSTAENRSNVIDYLTDLGLTAKKCDFGVTTADYSNLNFESHLGGEESNESNIYS
jgi:ankyrin repeat protein